MGLHVGISHARYETYDYSQAAMLGTTVRSSYVPIDLGLTFHVAPWKRISFAPWVGLQDQLEIERCELKTWHRPGHEDTSSCRKWDYQSVRQPSMGLTVAVDLSRRERHRATVFATFTHGIGGEVDGAVDEVDVNSDSLWVGVGYRYW
jgi:hypothetical protein